MSVLTTLPPAFSLEEAADAARELYGLDGALSPLDSERDQNFRLAEADGTSWVLKIANAAEGFEALDFQAALLRHAQAVDAGLPLPHLRATVGGDQLGRVHSQAGQEHFVRMVTWLPGQLYSSCARTPELLDGLGETLGRLDKALQGFGHPGAHRVFDWDIRQAGRSQARLDFLEGQQRRLAAHFLERFETKIAPRLARLRAQVIHGDANDNNLLVDGPVGRRITGLIDFGDAIHSSTIGELAVACAYAILEQEAPIEVAGRIAAAYHRVFPLQSDELDLLFDLIAMRLVTSVTLSASRRERVKDNAYLNVSEAPAWAMLARLRAMDPALASGLLRHACGFEAAPGARRAVKWIEANRRNLAPALGQAPARLAKAIVPFGDPTHPIAQASAARQPDKAEALWLEMAAQGGIELGVGPWCEERPVYSSAAFESVFVPGQRRSLHLGLDLFAPAGTAVRTPVDSKVVDLFATDLPLDYGHAVLLRHEPEPGVTFHSLWGHLSAETLRARRIGEVLKAGDIIGWMGTPAENGNWQPHVHIQLVTHGDPRAADVIGAGEAAYRDVWAELFPNPATFAGLPLEALARSGREKDELLKTRQAKLIRNLSISYRKPLKIVRGEGVWLIDETGRAYLDCYNNVAQLGHANPEIVEAMARQARTLNTNTRYLHDNIIAYAEALTATLPGKLKVAAFTCTGSEANDLALRMARTVTGARDVITLDWAYHGHTQALIEVSPYKYKRKGGKGRPETTWEVPLPDAYRAPADWPRSEIGARYAAAIREAATQIATAGRRPAAFIAESLPSSAGQIVLPDGYLKAAYEAAREAGAIVVADEVQIGFGRVGSHLWAFETQDAVPDIVTLGKPIGNGHPMAALVTTEEIADAFANGMEYFNTFGGNPVSCAAGLKVLEIIERDRLKQNATETGGYLLGRMRGLMERHEVIGDVRGLGLMLGIDLVVDRKSKAPATERAGRVVERCRELGVLMGTDGPFDNVIKMRPALIFTRTDADLLMEVLAQAFADTEA